MKKTRVFMFVAVLVSLGLVGVVLIARNNTRSIVESKFASYESIDELAKDTDTLIEGTVSGPGQIYFDSGGVPGEKGDRLKLFPITVVNNYRGNLDQVPSIWVFQNNWEGNPSVPMNDGDHLVMFLRSFPPGARVDLDKQFGKNSVFSQVGENASLFDVVGSVAVPREKSLVSLTGHGSVSTEFNIADLVAEARKVESASP